MVYQYMKQEAFDKLLLEMAEQEFTVAELVTRFCYSEVSEELNNAVLDRWREEHISHCDGCEGLLLDGAPIERTQTAVICADCGGGVI